MYNHSIQRDVHFPHSNFYNYSQWHKTKNESTPLNLRVRILLQAAVD